MPVHNGQRYLDEAIQSVLAQDFEDFELLAVDDGSVDATPEILRRWAARDARVVPVTLERRHGISGALNRGLEIARSDRIARHDADDIFLGNRLRAQVEALDAHPDAVLVSGRYVVVDEEARRLYTQSFVESHEITVHMLHFSNAVGGHGQVMFRRDVVRAIGGYDETLMISQDYDLWTRLAPRGRIVTVPVVCMRHRMHDARISVIHADRQRAESVSISSRALGPLLGRDLTPDEAEGLAAIWRAEGQACDTAMVDRLLRAALERSPFAVDPTTRRRLRILTSARWVVAAAALLRHGHLRTACAALRHAARWHPRGFLTGAVAVARMTAGSARRQLHR